VPKNVPTEQGGETLVVWPKLGDGDLTLVYVPVAVVVQECVSKKPEITE